jgi:16S rRNA (guanine1207-N2)-methyltransferase
VGYFDLLRLPDGSYTKPGMRGYPSLEPVQALLLEAVRDMNLEGIKTAVDLTARGGAVALELERHGLLVWVREDSAAAWSALRKTGLLPREEKTDLSCAILSGERGNASVRALLRDAFIFTNPSGICLLTGDKDRGFDRYFNEAISLFGAGEILERSKGLRVGRLEKTNPDVPIPLPLPEVFDLTARGKTLRCATFPGTFSSGKLDAASRLLLEHLPTGSGRNVLDIGAGYGALSGFLALEGATVCLLEDDGPSVRSCHETLALNTVEARIVHSDVDAKLEPTETFDLIVTNPPFHVGSDLILDVALEFIRCAERRLEPGGEFWLVANHFLPYEREMARIGTVREVVREKGFKVLCVRREE